MDYYHSSNSKCLFLGGKNAVDVYSFYLRGLQDFVNKKNTNLQEINVMRDILSLKNHNNL